MNRFRACFLILGVLLLCATTFGQALPTVYISGGPSSTVYTAPPSPATSLFTDGTNQLEGMVLGPDKQLYVCEPKNGRIVRFDTTAENPPATLVFSHSETGPQKPQCGHFTSTGDLIVSDEATGSGIWEFQNMAGSVSPTTINPSNVLGSGVLGGEFVGAGLTQLKNGDLAFVDSSGGNLYIAPYNPVYPHFSTVRPIPSEFGGAIGVARNSKSDIFVSYPTGQIERLSSTYVPSTSDFGNNTEFTTLSSAACFSSETDQPEFMQFSANDTLYVATQTTGNPLANPGQVLSITLNNPPFSEVNPACNTATQVATLPQWDSDSPGPVGDENGTIDSDDQYAQGFGIALPPTSVTINSTPANSGGLPAGPSIYDFGFSGFEAILPSAGACGSAVTVTETQVFPGNINNDSQVSNLGGFPLGVTAAEPFYGEGGFDNVYTLNDPDCLGASVNILIGAFSNLTNPRVVQCNLPTKPCVIDPSAGAFPAAALIPGDGVGGGKAGGPSSSFYMTNVPISTSTSGPTQAGYVCGFFFLRNLFIPDPTATVDPDDLLTITFRLTNKPANPATGPFCAGTGVQGISNAQVVATLAQISPFNLITLPNKLSPGSPPPFISLGLGWYAYVLNAKGFATGTYDFSAIFNTNNAPIQSAIINVVPED
jgi:hypothetical protein